MTEVKILTGDPHYKEGRLAKSVQEDLEEKINAFLNEMSSDWDLIDIKYETVWCWLGSWEDSSLSVSAMIIFKKKGDS